MATISAEEVSAVCFAPLTEAPERLGVFFGNVVYSMDGLETAFYAASFGRVEEAMKRMEMWHTEFAHLGYRVWAESYLAEIQRQNKFTLPICGAEKRRVLSVEVLRSLGSGVRPNPSLNRTPAGGLSPARRSPVSLLR